MDAIEQEPTTVEPDIENDERSRFTVVATTVIGGPFFSHPVHAVVRDETNGLLYNWNARHHRKMRFPILVDGKPGKVSVTSSCSIRILSWEPHIISWWIAWVGFVANTLWVINGLFATWPELAEDYGHGLEVSYYAGLFGAFLFVITGYLGIVEVLNQNHTDIAFPDDGKKREYQRTTKLYGKGRSPIRHGNHGLDNDDAQALIRSDGYPVICKHETGSIITRDDPQLNKRAMVGTEIDVVIGNHVITARVVSCEALRDSQRVDEYKQQSPYIWWSWKPDWGHMSVFGAYLFFVCTIIFFVPAAMWYPYDLRRSTEAVVSIFFVDVLQIIPSVGFIFVGHIGMAESSGSWFWATKSQTIGYYVACFNTLGGWGFLFCGIFAIPASADSGCCDQLTKWASGFSTFWGSCFFFIAGVLQCIEFANKHPICFFWPTQKAALLPQSS